MTAQSKQAKLWRLKRQPLPQDDEPQPRDPGFSFCHHAAEG
jgi:hypothetical protein